VPASASPASAIMLWLIFSTKIFTANGKLSLLPLSQPKGAVPTMSPYFGRLIGPLDLLPSLPPPDGTLKTS